VALYCCMFYTPEKAQDCMACDEELKSFLFTTVIFDGSKAYFPSDWSKWHGWMQENFNYFEVACMDSFSLKKPCRSCLFSCDTVKHKDKPFCTTSEVDRPQRV